MDFHVLIVEDDVPIAKLIEDSVRSVGGQTLVVSNGEAGLEHAAARGFALIVMDILLPGISGFEVCRRIRESDKITPILMITSQSDEADKVLGLELGADDYVVKPFSIREVTARIRVLLRRSAQLSANAAIQPAPPPDSTLSFGTLAIDPGKYEARLDGRLLALSSLEFDVLAYFVSHAGKAVSREELMQSVWGYECSQFESTVTTLISRLRHKIESDPENPRLLMTVRGVGYRFIDPGAKLK